MEQEAVIAVVWDMIQRYQQIVSWTNEMETPVCLWLSGLFNPTAFILHHAGHCTKDGLPLDNMTIATAVTAMAKVSEVTDAPPGGGRFVHGMFLEVLHGCMMKKSAR